MKRGGGGKRSKMETRGAKKKKGLPYKWPMREDMFVEIPPCDL